MDTFKRNGCVMVLVVFFFRAVIYLNLGCGFLGVKVVAFAPSVH
jgi:hypothetical protein